MLSLSTIVFFNFILLILTLITASVFLLDKFYYKQYADQDYEPNWIISLSYDLLPVLIIIMIVRTYIYEPFSIPSESMYPQLTNGDFIIVKKWSYSLKLPFTNYGIIDVNSPQRGDVAVFQYPIDKNTHFIKRVIGVPNDTLMWQDNDFFINDQRIENEYAPVNLSEQKRGVSYRWEYFGEKRHLIRKLQNDEVSKFNTAYDFAKLVSDRNFKEQGIDPKERSNTIKIKVPKDYYFVMGDNRDQSMDSRSWGFVHKSYFVGKAEYIVFHSNVDTPFWNIFNKITFNRNKQIS
ncbi:signal peptidase I [Acinetobacter baumannii]|uniref:signal peptidase I n=1 Tax=Acinetobacter baumannii TaxID=470 RepID=UPI0009A9BAB0|nr:signal peptidase I [Acinetobacter baumannii]